MSVETISRADLPAASDEYSCACESAAPPSPAIPELKLCFFLLACAWVGLLAGLCEASVAGFKKFILQRFLDLSIHIVWMAPVCDAVILVAIGFVWFAAARVVRLRASVFVSMGLVLFLGFSGVLFTAGWLHWFAVELLAAGLAVQAAKRAAGGFDAFQRLVRNTSPWLAVGVLLAWAGITGSRHIAERRALAALPTPPSQAPNVLLLVLDTVRAKSLSLYGRDRAATPRLEEFADRAVVIDCAFSTSPWTLPSHASIFTGEYPNALSADWRRGLDDAHPTLAEILSRHGYATAGFVSNTTYCGRQSGLDRGFAHYEDFPLSLGAIASSGYLGKLACAKICPMFGRYEHLTHKSAECVNRDFLQWLSAHDERPFFAFLNYMDAHDPYLPRPPFDASGPQTPDEKLLMHCWSRLDKTELPEAHAQLARASYEASISYLDHHVGLLLHELERRGCLKNTLVVVTSDHGEQFGEHGLFNHGNSLRGRRGPGTVAV